VKSRPPPKTFHVVTRHPAAEFRRLIYHSRALVPSLGALIRETLINSARARYFVLFPLHEPVRGEMDPLSFESASLVTDDLFFTICIFINDSNPLSLSLSLVRSQRPRRRQQPRSFSISALTDAGKSIDGSFKWRSDIFRCNPGRENKIAIYLLLVAMGKTGEDKETLSRLSARAYNAR